MKKKVSQEQIVLNHLQKKGKLSAWTAITKYGCTRLSARIYTLRQKGYNISTKTIKYRNRWGNNGTCAEYTLEG